LATSRIFHRRTILLGLDFIFVSAAFAASFVLRIGPEAFDSHWHSMVNNGPVLGALTVISFLSLKLYRTFTRFAGVETALKIAYGVTAANLVFVTYLVMRNRFDSIPRTVIIINWMANILVTGGPRLLWRAFIQNKISQSSRKGVLVYGSVEDSEGLLREFDKGAFSSLRPVGLVEPDPTRGGRSIHNVHVYGGEHAIEDAIANPDIEEVHFVGTLPEKKIVEKFLTLTGERHILFKTIPLASDAVTNGNISLSAAIDIRIEDLLKRDPQNLDLEGIRQFVSGYTVMITGAGGSIGSELVRQIALNDPKEMILVECSEENLHRVRMTWKQKFPEVKILDYLVNVTDEKSMDSVFSKHRPDLVFHAAAYKHVDLIEVNPCQGLVNNVEGLRVTASLSAKYGTIAFVFVSTDKAARPVNIMGASKRLGECLIKTLAAESDCKFVAVRFGNVLGSSGSVVPVFREQILSGGPVTVTHPEMTRFFMLPSEAVQLILQAASLGDSGKVYVLDMGDPVSISRMAKDMIRLLGRVPDRDVAITHIGLRPGEKLHEELYFPGHQSKTKFSGTWEDNYLPTEGRPVTTEGLQELAARAKAGDITKALRMLKEFVPDFHPMHEATQRHLAGSSDGAEEP